MINIDNVEKFINEELGQGEHFSLRKESWIELVTRLRQAEKDAERYRWLRDVADDFEINDFFMCSELKEKRDEFADEAMKCK